MTHIFPLGDIMTHEMSPDCVCLPEETLERIEGGTVFQFLHSALDGRPQRGQDVSPSD